MIFVNGAKKQRVVSVNLFGEKFTAGKVVCKTKGRLKKIGNRIPWDATVVINNNCCGICRLVFHANPMLLDLSIMLRCLVKKSKQLIKPLFFDVPFNLLTQKRYFGLIQLFQPPPHRDAVPTALGIFYIFFIPPERIKVFRELVNKIVVVIFHFDGLFFNLFLEYTIKVLATSSLILFSASSESKTPRRIRAFSRRKNLRIEFGSSVLDMSFSITNKHNVATCGYFLDRRV